MAFNFEPENGLLNTEEFPDKPASGTAARGQFMKLFNQVKDYINGMETKGVKANGGNADTVGGKTIGQLGDTHNHTKYIEKGLYDINGQDMLIHGKRALVGMIDGSLYLGYGGDFTHIYCGDNYLIWNSANFNPEEYAKTTIDGLDTDNWYWKDEKTGLIRQGGTATINFNNVDTSSTSINFKFAFPNSVKSIIASEKNNNITTRGMFNVACWENDNASATIQAVVMNLTPRTGNVTVYWEATGY